MCEKFVKDANMLVDTDVLIWYLRGNSNAGRVIDELQGFSISVVSYMELVQGMKNKKELVVLRKTLRQWNVKVIYITEEISIKAMFYVEQYFLSDALELADALIAATAAINGVPVLTGNDKHYKKVKEIEIKKFRP